MTPTCEPISVLTLDALPLVHGGVRQLLAAFPDLQLVGEAHDLGEAIHIGNQRSPHIVLVEIGDLGASWIDQFHRLRQSLPHARLVVFTLIPGLEQVREALRAGAQGYLLKRATAMSLAQALRSVAGGQQVFAPEVTQAILAAAPGSPLDPANLSLREREVLTLLARGLSNREISQRMYVSAATIKFHCSNLYGKLGVRTRAQAIAAAYTDRLIPTLIGEREPDVPQAGRSQGGARARSA
jgi:DNA-binding NarL/FixJ family response regulator